MEYKDDERPSLNGHGTRQLESPQHAAVPATLLLTVLSHLGLGDRPMADDDQAVTALQDEKSSVRVAAVRSLGERREVSSLWFLVPALHDPAWEVRAAAVWALSAFGRQAPVEALIEALDDKDGSVRAAALRVLSRVREHIPPESLARMLHDADWQVREAAALTVEELGEIEVLGDRYQLQDLIGRGGMATIYRGRDLRMDRLVAIKVLREVYNTHPKFVTRFRQEAKAASALQHPNIVQVYDYGQSDDNYYIVMELVEGTDLRRYLRSRGVLDTDRAIIIAHDVALGLGAAHRRGIVHRDVKPQNVLVGRDGSIKLTDFGIVSVYKDMNAERVTTTGMTLGTVQYFPPEQAQGEIVSPAADVYALGIVMYEMLTGRPPFDGNNAVAVAIQHIENPPIPPSQFNPNIPAALEEIILRCLEKVPEMRFRDGSQLARALETLGDAKLGESVTPGRAPIPTTSNQITSRPSNSGRGGTRQNVPPHSPASSPDNRMGPGVPSDQNDAVPAPGSLVNQSFAPLPGPATSYQFQRGTVPGSGVAQPHQRDWRFASIITLLILLATLLLLGFSVYLAVQLGFITLPFFNGATSPTPGTVTASVPNLVGDDYSTAKATAENAGFRVALANGQTSTNGVVAKQSPTAGVSYAKGSTIIVMMTMTTTVPLIGHIPAKENFVRQLDFRIALPNPQFKLIPKTLELLLQMPLAAPDWIDALHVESQRAAHLGFALHTPALKLEESMYPAHQR
jgi:eukaryotic-like serine/threonine-protein kinase